MIIFMVGNKIDCINERIITNDIAQHAARKNGLMFFEASAKTGEGIENLFQ